MSNPGRRNKRAPSHDAPDSDLDSDSDSDIIPPTLEEMQVAADGLRAFLSTNFPEDTSAPQNSHAAAAEAPSPQMKEPISFPDAQKIRRTLMNNYYAAEHQIKNKTILPDHKKALLESLKPLVIALGTLKVISPEQNEGFLQIISDLNILSSENPDANLLSKFSAQILMSQNSNTTPQHLDSKLLLFILRGLANKIMMDGTAVPPEALPFVEVVNLCHLTVQASAQVSQVSHAEQAHGGHDDEQYSDSESEAGSQEGSESGFEHEGYLWDRDNADSEENNEIMDNFLALNEFGSQTPKASEASSSKPSKTAETVSVSSLGNEATKQRKRKKDGSESDESDESDEEESGKKGPKRSR